MLEFLQEKSILSKREIVIAIKFENKNYLYCTELYIILNNFHVFKSYRNYCLFHNF